MISPARTTGNARLILKAATEGQHHSLDRGFAALDLKNRNDYRCFLVAQAAVLMPLENWLTQQGIADVLPDWPARQRREAMAADLAGLDTAAPAEDDVSAFDRPTRPLLLGVAYVLEGSRLGAQYLSRAVANSPDRSVRDNMRFLGHGAGQKLWPGFLDILEREAADPAAAVEATAGARATFDLFLRSQQRHAPALAVAGA